MFSVPVVRQYSIIVSHAISGNPENSSEPSHCKGPSPHAVLGMAPRPRQHFPGALESKHSDLLLPWLFLNNIRLRHINFIPASLAKFTSELYLQFGKSVDYICWQRNRGH